MTSSHLFGEVVLLGLTGLDHNRKLLEVRHAVVELKHDRNGLQALHLHVREPLNTRAREKQKMK